MNAVVTTENASLDTGPVKRKPAGMIYVLISLLPIKGVITPVAMR